MKEQWDIRYGAKEYAYGEEPNNYLKEKLALLPIGKILFPAEGEGRNAVYAATLGWEVSAFDLSVEGKKKAIQLADKKQVSLAYHVCEFSDLEYPPNEFDAIALIYAHFQASEKSKYHKILSSYLNPGGMIIFEAFSKNHLAYRALNEKVGGPKDLDMLYSVEELQADFSNYEILELKEEIIELKEGVFHNGLGSVIRFVGKKL